MKTRTAITCFLLIILFGVGCEDSDSEAVDQACATNDAIYNLAVSEILFQNCTYCHSSELAMGGVVLDTYEDARTVGQNGQLLGAIRHDTGFSPMPQGVDLGRTKNCEGIRSFHLALQV